jgi:hypothetical protein
MPVISLVQQRKMRDSSTFDKNSFVRSCFGWSNIALSWRLFFNDTAAHKQAHTIVVLPAFLLPSFLDVGLISDKHGECFHVSFRLFNKKV